MELTTKSTAAKIMVFDSLRLANDEQTTTLLIDDFTLAQHVGDNGVDASPTSSLETLNAGTELDRVIRQVSALATGGIYEFETVIIGGSFLKINNSGGSNGSCFIEYSFEPTDFNALATGILLNAVDVDFEFFVNVTINAGQASTGYQLCSGGPIFLPYTAFIGDRSQFNQVSLLRLDFKMQQSSDTHNAQITQLNDYRKLPNPAILNLLGLGNVELGGFYQKKPA